MDTNTHPASDGAAAPGTRPGPFRYDLGTSVILVTSKVARDAREAQAHRRALEERAEYDRDTEAMVMNLRRERREALHRDAESNDRFAVAGAPRIAPLKFSGFVAPGDDDVEAGTIIARAEYQHDQPHYLVRYRAGDGRQVETWWGEDALLPN